MFCHTANQSAVQRFLGMDLCTHWRILPLPSVVTISASASEGICQSDGNLLRWGRTSPEERHKGDCRQASEEGSSVHLKNSLDENEQANLRLRIGKAGNTLMPLSILLKS
jgi:hypothetical protein